MTSNEALSMATCKFLEIFSEELVRIFGDDIFSMPNYEDLEEYIVGPPIVYLEGTVGWVNSFKKACNKTGMKKLSDWYCSLNWMESDEFDGELGELLIRFNTKYTDGIEELRSKIDAIMEKLRSKIDAIMEKLEK